MKRVQAWPWVVSMCLFSGAVLSACGDPSSPEEEFGTQQSALTEVTGFGTNPGALRMFTYVPASMPTNAPLVVALHGCSQSATAYENAGWNPLADTYKFYVVYAQQQATNNISLCFNLFSSYYSAKFWGLVP